MPRLNHVIHLGIKELWSLWRDPMMLFLIVFVFTVAIVIAGTSAPETLNRAAIAIVDEDASALSARIESAFSPPQFMQPEKLALQEIDRALDTGRYTFVLVIPENFQRDIRSSQLSVIQLNIDATRMSQAFVGSGTIAQIVASEVAAFFPSDRAHQLAGIRLIERMRFNPNLDPGWFTALMELVNHITMLSLVLVGTALIREREHGTIEHLLSMPVTQTEIMLSKIWPMMLVVLLAAGLSLTVIVQRVLEVPIEGSIPLFLVGTVLHLFATASLGIFLASFARNMPQFGLLILLVLMPLEQLSGAITPRESMPDWVAYPMLLAPTTHFTELSQAILYRGAGLDAVLVSFLALGGIGVALFAISLAWFSARLPSYA
jgi:ABC-2 type transport system permease protein